MTETWNSMFPFCFCVAETCYSLPWTCHFFVMIPEWKYDEMLHFTSVNRILLLPVSIMLPCTDLNFCCQVNIYVKCCAILASNYHEVLIIWGQQRWIDVH